ncbi:MAG TPA: TonB-dependent receptor, partial [Candidatus Tumulicola sp.]
MRFWLRAIACALYVAALIALFPVSVLAQTIFFQGTVVDEQGHPLANAIVQVSGQSVTLTQTSDAAGHFAFQTLTVGSYRLVVSKGDLHVSQPIELASAGLTIVVTLSKLQVIGHVVVATTNPVVKRSGTDVTIDAGQLARLPTGNTLPGILTQMPSDALGSNGQVHVNGDHNGLNYYIDGVQVPANLNRVLGTEIDPSNIGYLDILEGAYPAQYGDKFAAILNIGTKANAGPAGFEAFAQGGSFNTYQGSVSMHEPIGTKGGSLTLAGFLGRDSWGLDPAVLDPVHNDSSDSNGFLRLSLPVAGLDTLNLDAIHSLQTFQIPPDTGNGVPPWTDDDEYQSDTFVALQYRHAIGNRGSLQFGPSLTVSNILDTNDPAGDLAAGGPPPPSGQTNCTDFTDCLFSVYADRTARDYRFNLDYALTSAHHTIRAGALYDGSSILKNYAIAVQPYSALDTTGSFVATDTTPNVAHQQEAYLADSWLMGKYQLDYGIRMDAFQIFSTNFDKGYSQWSPRIKLTRVFGPRASFYVYYGRLFVPFSFENVNPATAASLY